MAAHLIMRRTLSGMAPDNDIARQMLAKVRLNEAVRVEIKRPRSLAWHRRYWALVSLIADNTERHTADEIHDLIKLHCGCTKVIRERNGTVWTVPDSIAFDRMDTTAWALFWDRVAAFVCAELLPGVTKETLARELGELVGVAA